MQGSSGYAATHEHRHAMSFTDMEMVELRLQLSAFVPDLGEMDATTPTLAGFMEWLMDCEVAT